MPDQPKPHNPSRDVALKEHMESLLRAQREYLETRLNSIEQATKVATRILDSRLDAMNEFRDALKDQAARLATREELTIQVNKLTDDIIELKQFRAVLEGKASQQSVNIALFLSTAGLLIGVIGLAMKIVGG